MTWRKQLRIFAELNPLTYWVVVEGGWFLVGAMCGVVGYYLGGVFYA